MWDVPENERMTVTSENVADLLIASAKEALTIERGEMAPALSAGRFLPIREAA